MSRWPVFLLLVFLSACRTRTPVIEPHHAAFDVQAFADRVRAGDVDVVDLTLRLDGKTPYFPGGEAFTLAPSGDIDKDGYYANHFAMGEHTGTHIDAPCHFAKGRWSVDDIPLSHLVASCCVVEVTAQAEKDPDYALCVRDLELWEASHGRIPDGAVVVMRSGWGTRVGDLERYRNADTAGVLHFPGFSREAAEWLVRERTIVGVGVDTLSVDPGPSKDYGAHHALCGADKYNLENLGSVEKLPEAGAVLVVAPLAIRGGSGSPVRVYALVGKR